MQVSCKTWEAKASACILHACGRRLEQRLVRIQYHSTPSTQHACFAWACMTPGMMWVSKMVSLTSGVALSEGWSSHVQYLR
jgi:hypothetical protein